MITKADCPPNIASGYPGKWGRNNRSGSLLSRNEYTEKLVKDWIDHFEGSENYQNAMLSNKAVYLTKHLVALKVPYKVALKHLVELESKQSSTVTSDNVEGENNEDEVEVMEGNADIELRVTENTDAENVDMEEIDEIEDMFCDDSDTMESASRKDLEFEIATFLSKSNKELFEEGLDVPKHVQNSRRYMVREKEYTETYVDENMAGLSSQEILEQFSQNPPSVQESNAMKLRLKHLANEDKANRTALKAIRDTIAHLQKTPGQEAKKQVKTLAASVTHHKWGMPALPGVGHRGRKEVKQMKMDFLKGKTSILTPPVKPKKKIYPKEVEELAVNHWRENTVVEPALHNRKTVSDEKETIPTRYQSLTDKEQYSQFKEDCSEQIAEILRLYALENIEILHKRRESADREKRLAYFATLHRQFPSYDWYHDRKPAEIKPLHDHTTALCKTCEAALLNYVTVVKAIKSQCRCTTNHCPNWICMCQPSSDDEEGPSATPTCSCKCACDDCTKCKVNK